MSDDAAPAFRPLTGIYEPSAIQQWPDGRFLVVEDENEHPLSLVTIGADGTVETEALTAGLLQMFSPFWKLDDLEGLAVDRAGFVYGITSHSRDDDGDEKKSREKLVRFRVEGGRVVNGLKGALTAQHAVLAAAAQIRDVKAGSGLNIEGLEISPDQQRLLIGLRSPLRDGRALIASVENPAALFDMDEAPRIAHLLEELDLGGHGIRGLSCVPALAPADGVPGLAGFEKAEGVSPAVVDSLERIVVVSDDGSRDAKRFANFLLLDPAQLQTSASQALDQSARCGANCRVASVMAHGLPRADHAGLRWLACSGGNDRRVIHPHSGQVCGPSVKNTATCNRIHALQALLCLHAVRAVRIAISAGSSEFRVTADSRTSISVGLQVLPGTPGQAGRISNRGQSRFLAPCSSGAPRYNPTKESNGEVLTFFCARFVSLSLLVALLSACSPRMLLVKNVADELASQGQAEEVDLMLARDASAFYLKLSESVLRQTPGHLPLAEAVASGFTQYAYAFVAFEADRTEAQDARAAQRLRERAARLYWRANRHAMAALEINNPDFVKVLSHTPVDSGVAVVRLPPDQVGVAYWAAASWGAHISLSKDKPDVVADLPLAIRLARQAWMSDPSYGKGALASLMGTFEAARPGGSLRQAQAYFDQASDAGQGSNAGVYVARAEALAMPSGDRASFEALLRLALAISLKHRDLGNEVMRERAQWLLDTADDRF